MWSKPSPSTIGPWTTSSRLRSPRKRLLGPQRAKLLLELDSPRAAGALADLLFTVPSAITHDVRALEASGLVSRSPQGRQVIISRTSRGTTLLGLYNRLG